MMNFSVLILGSSSATPTLRRHLSAQVVNVHEELFLVDCGEWTQMQLKYYHIRFQRINHIFISHLHGDHYLGLPGLIFTLHLLGRKTALHVYADPELENILGLHLKVSDTVLLYPLIFHPIEPGSSGVIYEDDHVEVKSFPLLHKVPTHGFLFREKKGRRKIRKEALSGLAIPAPEYEKLKEGKDIILPGGITVPNEQLTSDPGPSRSYAYCSDTGFTDEYLQYIRGVDLLYHEATFMNDKMDNAREKMHSTTIDAATIAKKTGAKKLIIGHYSARYDELQPMLDETRSVFENSYLTEDGMIFEVI
jgi:ribonuclease Z